MDEYVMSRYFGDVQVVHERTISSGDQNWKKRFISFYYREIRAFP